LNSNIIKVAFFFFHRGLPSIEGIIIIGWRIERYQEVIVACHSSAAGTSRRKFQQDIVSLKDVAAIIHKNNLHYI